MADRRFAAHGRVLVLRGTEERLTEVHAHLPPWYVETTADADLDLDLTAIQLDGEALVDGNARATASRIELAVMASLSDVTVLHAGVVGINGWALLLPGRSMTGKSTLVRALLARGADYLSDEYALIRDDATVLAYPRALTLRGQCERVDPARIGATVPTEPLPVRAVAVLSFDAAVPDLDVTSLSPGQLLLRLVDNCVGVRRAPGPTLERLSTLCETARGFAGRRGEAEAAAAGLAAEMTSTPS